MDIGLQQLSKVYQEIHDCHICPNMNNVKALRRIDAIDSRTDIMIISQALAEGQLRHTGVNFFTPEGKRGRTGTIIEKFMNKFNRTIYPACEILLDDDIKIPACQKGLIPIYNTEIAQCFPGKKSNGKGDKPPDDVEIFNCYKNGFLLKEIDLIKPKLIILHGDISRINFYKYYLRKECPKHLNDHIDQIIKVNRLPIFTIQSATIKILPMMHVAAFGNIIGDFIENTTILALIKDAFK